ncbi:hypothetical protein M231_01981 [Tremella mesenterica]|uniref:Uncharacterized protein n=1 Tax=Tremella mesenterica TaxID=5217 RepID=A0A4Q1BRY2_TREME|nr:hypothetical protein M231_01981 [Tremella mesenterica]
MFLYNVHTPHKTFALVHKDGEGQVGLVNRICKKAGLGFEETTAVKEGKDGAGLIYEYEGERWSLDDDDDLDILFTRFPPSSTPSVTLQLTPPPSNLRAHFAPPPPAYSTPSSLVKSKAQSQTKKSTQKSSPSHIPASSLPKSSDPVEKTIATIPNGTGALQSNGTGAKPNGVIAHKPKLPTGGRTAGRAVSVTLPTREETLPAAASVPRAKSVMSTRSRKSRWGDDDAEPLGVTKKREWEEFHANNGVRTVVGRVANIDGVRMLLKSGYRHVYVSRSFAIRAGLVDRKYGTGFGGYSGLRMLGQVPITVGGKTASHVAMISEEQHFEVILGRSWMERMGVK